MATMEKEQWTTKYQQSVPTGLVVKEDNLNNGNTDNLSEDGESSKNTDKDENNEICVKTEPDAETRSPPNITISKRARNTIRIILEEIKTFSQIEKFLLFLKLPAEVSNAVDPFRQPLNPLGSRLEIYRTISWIKTHLEEDPDISLPKQQVYSGYCNYCEKNAIKPLSQADFGKVMKQVYPKVRARRLGTRGNSRYCYSGLRRCMKLKTPLLPDLVDKPMSTEAPFTQSNLTSTAWLIVKEWSEQQLGAQFSSIQSLAYYLILNKSVSIRTEAATKIVSAEESIRGEDTRKVGNKHREMQLQLQKKIQQKNEGKERKRKLQSPKSETQLRLGAKKYRSQSVPSPSTLPTTSPSVASGECSTTSSSTSTSPTVQGKPICDFVQLPALPDFNSFQKPTKEAVPDKIQGNTEQETTTAATTKKTAITRLQQPQVQMTTTFPTNLDSPPNRQARPIKYKLIQPRLQHCDIASYNRQPHGQAVAENRSQDLHDIDRIKDTKSDDDCDVADDFPLTRERLNSVSNVAKDAMDEYLGTNNSQHEEELSKYFSNNNVPDMAGLEKTSKLSTLRQLLEQNGIDHKHIIQSVTSETTFPGRGLYAGSNLHEVQVQPSVTYGTPTSHLCQLSSTGQSNNGSRRVSFETPAQEEAVPPSPNTRRKNFSFTPISPGPQSPNSMLSKHSRISPFISPRSTPKSRNKTHALKDVRKPAKIKMEPDMSLEVANDLTNYMPMSAPASPLLNSKSVLQNLLNSTSKVPYNPGYSAQNVPLQADISLEVSQFFSARNMPPTMDSYRSQSAPLHPMIAKSNFPVGGFLTDTANSDFTELDPIPESDNENVKRILNSLDEQACDNNNIDLFNLDLSANNPCLPEFGLHLINNNLEISSFSENNSAFDNIQSEVPMARSMRSQSIDVNMIAYEIKCNPSRSVPSTPLPFTQTKPQTKSNGTHSSRSYPTTPLNSEEAFTYNVNIDCLLNGQPIRTDGVPENVEYLQDLNMNSDSTAEQLAPQAKGYNVEGHDFVNVEDNVPVMDDSCMLLEQNYNGTIN